MTKNYPYIYSLSTLGVIHHYKCDYLFHPLRTDFTGESGSGKSMIGDFLQLIFVGAKFKSSTIPLKGEKKREIRTMVLSKGNKTANAYIFINIEVEPKQFLVVGVFIKSSANDTKHFIIQKGFDKSKPNKYLDKPLVHSDLLFDDTIYELSELKGLLNTYQCFEYRIDVFAKTLKELGVLPYNLETEEQRNNFSIIIRAFAQGKGLKTDNSDSLIKFLFDDNSEKEIISFWKSGSEKIEKEVRTYYKTNRDIDIIKGKANKVIKFATYQDNHEKSEAQYINSLCFDYNDRIINEEEDFKEQKKLLTKYMLKKLFIEEKSKNTEKSEKETVLKTIAKNKERIEVIDHNIERLSKTDIVKELNSIQEELNKLSKPNSDILEVTEWFKNQDLQSLKEHYSKQQEVEQKLNVLEKFLNSLRTKQIQATFDKSFFSVNYEKAVDLYKITIDKLEKEISFLETIKKISNPNEQNSLAGWAINRITETNKPFSKEEESLLVYLQSLPKEKRINKEGISRYLESPDVLFEKLEITDIDNIGFWLTLNGIKEYIPFYAKEQILNSNNINAIKELFAQKYKVADKLLKRNQFKLSKRNRLLAFIDSYDNKEALKIYPERKKLTDFTIIKGLTVDFETKISNYNNRENIKDTISKLTEKQTELKTVKTQIKELNEEKKGLVEYLDNNPLDKLQEVIKEINIKLGKTQRKLDLYDKRTELYFVIYNDFVNECERKSLDELRGENTKSEDVRKKVLAIYRKIKQLQKEYIDAQNIFFLITGKNFSPTNVVETLERTI